MNDDDDHSYFDDYAEDYEDLISEQTSFFAEDRDYFSWHKADILRRVASGLQAPKRILDFGCGIGLTIPFIKEAFPDAEIYGSDISTKSLKSVEKSFGVEACISDKNLDQYEFDIILISCVFHHIPPREREEVMKRLSRLLKPQGVLCIVEHNPYNPVTRHLVNTCPFDEDAVLLTMHETNKLISKLQNMDVYKKAYCLFFPESLKALNKVEPLLQWIPLGGQYYVAGQFKT